MSKNTKATARQKRLNKKRALKIANKAKYESWRNSGINNKSSRSRRSTSKNKLAKSIDHSMGHCGNLACKRCYPEVLYFGKIY